MKKMSRREVFADWSGANKVACKAARKWRRGQAVAFCCCFPAKSVDDVLAEQYCKKQPDKMRETLLGL